MGFSRAGIETVLQAECDPWALRVLARHFPDVERVTDVRAISGDTSAHHGPIDLVYGGFPCQPFSVAGLRAGAGDERNLWPEFRRIVSLLRPRWVVAENVFGLLSLDEGRFFGGILDDLGDLGFEGVAYAILDSQFFRIPQRRRRVYVVAGPTRRGVEQVLGICEGCRGDPPPRREAREAAAGATAPSARGGGPGVGANVATSLTARYGKGTPSEVDDTLVINLAGPTVADTVRGHPRPGSNSTGMVIPFDLTQITSPANYSNPQPGDPCHPLAASARAPVIAQTLTSGGHPGSNPPGRHQEDDANLVIADCLTAYDGGTLDHAGSYGAGPRNAILGPSWGVRRLTPLEGERLMGWADDWTRWTDDGQEIPDSHRYRLIGNGVVATVAEWLAQRLVVVDRWMGGER